MAAEIMEEKLRRFLSHSKRISALIMPVLRIIRKMGRRIIGGIIYWRNKYKYNRLNDKRTFIQHWNYDSPCYYDRFESVGVLGTYFWQDLWAARLIHKNNPEIHWDIGSRIDGFIGHLASFRDNIKLIDIRPLDSKIPGVDFYCTDATSLKSIPNDSVESLSALCSF